MKEQSNGKIPVNVVIPNMITSGSVFCGIASLVMTLHCRFNAAALLIFFAVFFDVMDGRVARKLNGSSAFGEQLDSLADALSFGAAPAILVYSAYLSNTGINSTYLGGVADSLGIMAAAFFTLCGILRLARFNVCHVPAGPFQGLPIPAGGLTLASLVLARFQLSPLVVMFGMFFVGVLMVSSVPYCNAKKMHSGNVIKGRFYSVIALIAAIFFFLRFRGFIVVSLIYIATGLFGIDLAKWATKEDTAEIKE